MFDVFISDMIQACYVIDPMYHHHLYYCEAAFIAFCDPIALGTIEGNRANGGPEDFR